MAAEGGGHQRREELAGWRKVDDISLNIGRRSRGIAGSDHWAFDSVWSTWFYLVKSRIIEIALMI